MHTSTKPDLSALKTRQQLAWASGDYAVIGTTLQVVGELLAVACDLRWGEDVLDVAAGNGNATLAAARRGCRAASIAVTRRFFNFRYRSAAHFIEVFRTWYGPVQKVFAALPDDKAAALERDLTALLASMNRDGADSLVVPSEYLEIVVMRR